MKKSKKGGCLSAAIIVIVLIAILFFFKGNIYQMAVKYEDAGSRKTYKIKDDNLASYINQNLPNDESLDANIDIDAIINLSQEITDKTFTFSLDIKENDPQKTIIDGQANCVGYAAFTAAVGNYLIDRFNLKDWEAQSKKGKLYLFGNNMHKHTEYKWFKDHDFVIFKNKNTKEEIYADPTAYDYFGAKRVDKRKK